MDQGYDPAFADRARAAVAGLPAAGLIDPRYPTERRHACPECPVGYAKPLCPVCLGTGVVTDLQLRQYERDLRRDAGA